MVTSETAVRLQGVAKDKAKIYGIKVSISTVQKGTTGKTNSNESDFQVPVSLAYFPKY